MKGTQADPNRWLSRSVVLARSVLGGAYFIGGAETFTHFSYLPIPQPLVGEFMAALLNSNMLTVAKAMELIFGALLLLNLWVPLSLACMAPVLFFIAWVDWYMDPNLVSVPSAFVIAIPHLFLMFVLRDTYRSMFVRRASL